MKIGKLPISPGFIVPILLFIFSLASLFPLLLGRFPAIGDMRDVYIPLELFFQHQQIQGIIPAWNSFIAWGFPVIASAQIGFFYPPLLILRWLPVSIYLPIILVLHLFLSSLGTFKLFRVLHVSTPGALLGALVFSLGGFFTLHLTHLNIFMAAAWLPWQLYFLHRLTTTASHRPKYLILSIFSLGLPLLAGQIQIPILMIIFGVIWLTYSSHRHLSRSAVLRLIIIILLASLLLGAAQLFPTLELTTMSSRANSESFNIERANQYSYPLYHLPSTLFPFFYGNDDTYWGKRLQIEYGFYFGTIPFLLLLSASLIWFKRTLPISNSHKFWLIVAVVSFLLSLGDLSPFRLIGLEPSLWYFSAPSRWLLFTSIALSYFIAHSLDGLISQIITRQLLIRRLSLSLLIIILFANILLLSPLPQILLSQASPHLNTFQVEKLSSLLNSAASSTLSLTAWPTWIVIVILSLLITVKFNTPKHLARFFIILTAIELCLVASQTTPYLSWSNILSPPDTINSLPSHVLQNQSRILTITNGGDTGAYFTNPDTRANTHIRADQKDALVPLINSQHHISGSAWPASIPVQATALALTYIQEEYRHQNSNPAARYNIGAILDISDNSLQVHELQPSNRYAFISSQSSPEVSVSPIISTHQSLSFNLESSSPGTLIIRDTWYPGWTAQLNGQAVSIDKHQEVFRAIKIPAGINQISLKYSSSVLYLGLIITLITATFLLLIIIIHMTHFFRIITNRSL